MLLNEVIVRIRSFFERERAANISQWRMVRRLCFFQAKTMGNKLNSEEELWEIEGDAPTSVSEEKLKAWEAFAKKKMNG